MIDVRKVSNLSNKEWRKVRKEHLRKNDFDFDQRDQNLRDVKMILDKLSIPFWLTNGTALAAVREKNWIPWDDDTDLDTRMEDVLKHYDVMREYFLQMGFVVRSNNKPKKAKFSLFRGKEKIAIRCLYLDPSFQNDKYRLRLSYKYPKKFYEKPYEWLTFRDMNFRVPTPSEEFLVYVYGKDWHTPIKSDNESVYSTSKIKR